MYKTNSELAFGDHSTRRTVDSVLSGKYRGGISRAVFPGKYRPVQYPQSGKYREILGNINNLLVFCDARRIFNGVLRAKYRTTLPRFNIF